MGLGGAEERGESLKGNWMSMSVGEYVGRGVVGLLGSSMVGFASGSKSVVSLVIGSSIVLSFVSSIAVFASFKDNPSSAAVTLTESLEIENPTFEKQTSPWTSPSPSPWTS